MVNKPTSSDVKKRFLKRLKNCLNGYPLPETTPAYMPAYKPVKAGPLKIPALKTVSNSHTMFRTSTSNTIVP